MKRIITPITLSLLLLSSVNAYGLDLKVTAMPLERSYPVGDALKLGYSLSWEDGGGDYVLLPPVLPELDWGRAELLSLTVRREGSQSLADILIEVIASESGQHNFPPLELKVVPLDTASAENEMLVPLPLSPSELVTTEALSIQIVEGNAFLKPLLLAAVVLLLALVLWHLRRQKKAAASEEPAMSLAEELAALLHEARRFRLDGNYYETYRSLQALAMKCQDHGATPSPALLSRLEEGIKDCGYRGKRPSESDLEGDFKDVEQLCVPLRSHGTQGAR